MHVSSDINAIDFVQKLPSGPRAAMSYYFCIVGTKDNPLFELEFGTSKQGGDGVARFSAEARRMNPFIVHSSLDIVDEAQWLNNQMYTLPFFSFSLCSSDYK